jgi:cytochrome c oxidase subunit 3
MKNNTHQFHIVDPSPWPLIGSIGALILTIGGVMYMHNYINGAYILLLGIISLIMVLILWWRDVIREATFLGHHSNKVQKGLRYGMILFIISEIMFFFAFFWAFFHASLAPTVEIGCIWPPMGIKAFSPFEVPLLNTVILLLSGATITVAHYAILINNRLGGFKAFFCTISLALLFTLLQAYEYFYAPFSISDGIYGSTFFMATGFHGFHVIIGTIFIVVCMFRFINYHFTSTHHFGFEAAAWYWHFVDVVWLFLYINIYFLGYYNYFNIL